MSTTISPNCLCKNPPPHTVAEHNAIKASNAVQAPAPAITPKFTVGLNCLFVGQPVSYASKIIPDVPIVREWDAQTNMPLPNSQHEKNLITNLLKMPNSQHVVQLGTDKPGGIPDATYVAILQNLLKIKQSHPNLFGIALWNEPNAARGLLAFDREGQLAEIARYYVGGKLFILGPSSQGEGGIRSYLQPWVQKYGHLVDAIDHHIYYWKTGPTVYNDVLNNMVKPCVAIAKSVNKPMWHTEGGLINQPDGSVKGDVATQFLKDYLRAIHDGGSECFLYWGFDVLNNPLNLINHSRDALTAEGNVFMSLAHQYNNS